MLKDCDGFSDSYGCVITKSVAYQSPFPLVRLSNAFQEAEAGVAALQGACFATSVTDRLTPRGRLLTMSFTSNDSCASLLQLLGASPSPVALDLHTTFVQKIERGDASTVVVSRSNDRRWSASLYVAATPPSSAAPSRVVFDNVAHASLRGGSLWLMGAQSREDGSRPLYHRSVQDALAVRPSHTIAVSAALQRPVDVVGLTESTAAVLGAGGAALADHREKKTRPLVAASIANGGAAAGDALVLFGEDYALRVFDLRQPSTPLFEASSASYLRVKACVGSRTALLVSGDVTGVLDLQTLAVTASLQHAEDPVLDAALLPCLSGGVRVCASTEAGLIYDWTVAT